MTLLEAFRAIAPPQGDGSVESERRREACVIVYEALHREVGAIRQSADLDQADREDVATLVFERICKAGPRGERADDPTDDGSVRAWLRRSLANALVDHHRAARSRRTNESSSREQSAREAPDGRPEPAHDVQVMAQVEHRLFDVIVPAMAREMQQGNLFLDTIELLRDIRRGKRDLAAVVRKEAGEIPAASEEKRARNRLDKRFSRTIAALHGEIDRLSSAGKATAEEVHLLRRIVASLRLRSPC